MTTSSSTTVDIVAAPPFTAPVEAPDVLDHRRHRSFAARLLHRVLDALLDAGALLVVVWMIPFVILAICTPIVLALWAILALIRRL